MLNTTDDIDWLQQALLLAKTAAQFNEVPVGAILVQDNQIIGQGYNCPIRSNDPTAHAEIIALRAGAKKINNYRLLETTLYVTLEPCAMCASAMVHARIKRLVFGAADPKAGAVGSVLNLLELRQLNHRVKVEGGLLAEECGLILKHFFLEKRRRNNHA